MEAPKCKLCEQRHYGLCPVRTPRAMRIPRSDWPEPVPDPAKPPPVERVHAVTDTWKGFDRVAYQREYMRKRRAKAKVGG